MNSEDAHALHKTIGYLKKQWSLKNDPGGFTYNTGYSQGMRDAIQAIVAFFRMDIEIDMRELPADFNIKEHIFVYRKNRRKS